MTTIRHARHADLSKIVEIYNAAIPGRMATADTSPVSAEDREAWFAGFDPETRPLWVACEDDVPLAWLSLRSFYGRPAYHETVEVGVYTAPVAQRRGLARALLRHALREGPRLGVRTILAFVFGHNRPSLTLFAAEGFATWGTLPEVADLDGVRRDLVIMGRTCTAR